MNPAILFLLAIPLIGVGLYFAWKKEQQRRERLHQFALSNGWTYSLHDPYGLAHRWDDHPFGKGQDRDASNVVEGSRGGRPFVSFDYKYEERHSDSKGHTKTTTYRFHVTSMQLPAALTELHVTTENVLSRLGNAIGFDDIELESEDFNRQYRVRCGAAKFAHDVLHPRTMEALLQGDALPFRITGNAAIVWQSGRAEPERLLAQLARLECVIDGIPGFVWKDHGYDPASASTPGVDR